MDMLVKDNLRFEVAEVDDRPGSELIPAVARLWTACETTRQLSDHVRQHFAELARMLLNEMHDYRLEVILVDSDPNHKGYWGPGHKLRKAINQNPDWYRDLYNNPRYIQVRRAKLQASLGRLVTGDDRPHAASGAHISTHDCVARSLVLHGLLNGYAPEPRSAFNFRVSPADCIRTGVFGLDPVNPAGTCQTMSEGSQYPEGWVANLLSDGVLCGIDG